MRVRGLLAVAGILWAAAAVSRQLGSEPVDLDHPAVQYRQQASTDPVADLRKRLESGESQLSYEARGGYLRSLLRLLDIPIESQIAVFSGTSLQSPLITAANPRVLYFNDSTVIAWVPGGFIEIAAQDPKHGTRFYTLAQTQAAKPVILAEGQLLTRTTCLGCHYSVAAEGVPGLLLRSIPATENGAVLPWLGNYITDHRSPFDERWGGWYVTGTPGPIRHLGNLVAADRRATDLPPWDSTRVISRLGERLDSSAYLTPHSDIVALLAFDHQARMSNLLTRFGWLARIAALEGRGVETVQAAAADVVDYMLFVGEPRLGGVRGSSGFAVTFAARGPRDSKGRSLRDLDLSTRLMRYPCSYMIYSAAFDALSDAARALLYRRLADVLSGADPSPKYAHLSAADRTAIAEIVRETKANVPPWF